MTTGDAGGESRSSTHERGFSLPFPSHTHTHTRGQAHEKGATQHDNNNQDATKKAQDVAAVAAFCGATDDAAALPPPPSPVPALPSGTCVHHYVPRHYPHAIGTFNVSLSSSPSPPRRPSPHLACPPPAPPLPPPRRSVVTASAACACLLLPRARPRCCVTARLSSTVWVLWEATPPQTCPWYVVVLHSSTPLPSFPSLTRPLPPIPACLPFQLTSQPIFLNSLSPSTLLSIHTRTTASVVPLPTLPVAWPGWGRPWLSWAGWERMTLGGSSRRSLR